MPEILLEEYIIQHIEASPEPVIRFSWHGGEPTLAGLDFFRSAVMIQRRHRPAGRTILNGMQTNGTLLDDDWGGFLAAEGFYLGLSLDGPEWLHDRYRSAGSGEPTFRRVMRGYEILRRYGIPADIICVVNSCNVKFALEVYRFFREIGAGYVTFLPLVEPETGSPGGVSGRSVTAEAWGDFLIAVFDEWLSRDIGRIKVQIFEEALRTAFGQEHSLCIFRPVCGEIPVLEHNGDLFACDHYVDREHLLGNIVETPLAELLESPARRSFARAKLDTLPRRCRECDVRDMCNGECPRNRFLETGAGESGLNYLCAGYLKFFRHCRPFIDQVSAAWNSRDS